MDTSSRSGNYLADLSPLDLVSRRVAIQIAIAGCFSRRAMQSQEPVSTVLMILQAVGALATLFGPKGPSLVDLANAQMTMLENISAQIKLVNDGIIGILSRLDEFERLIGELPDRTANAKALATLKGSLQLFNEDVATHTQLRRTKGLDAG